MLYHNKITLSRSIRSLIFSVLFTLVSLPLLAQKLSKQIYIQEGDNYLNFPIVGWSDEFEGDYKVMRVIHEGKVLDEFRISLANNNPDWWAFFPVTDYQGEFLTVELDDPSGKAGLDQVFADPGFPGEDDLYKERYRQQVHFSSRRGWINDPNGLIWYNGEWHLFYQHNPYGWAWGNMHWGHAVSTDLVHWEELSDVFYTPSIRNMAFSGGAVFDPENIAGFRKDGVDPLIVSYTRTGSGEHLAMSYDNGRTFEEYEGNPVVEHRGRDPKIFWYEPGNHWVMIVYDSSHYRELAEGEEAMIYQFAIYTSDDMKEWEYQSAVSDFWECPELFELPVEGKPGETKWMMHDAYGKYLIGDFNGKEFTPEQPMRRFEYGESFYASQTFSNVPEEDGRRIQIGWFRTATPYMPFNQSMGFPVELKLKKTALGYQVTPTPVEEINKLHGRSYKLENVVINDTTITSPLRGNQLHIIAEFDKGAAVQFGLNINGYEISYDMLKSTIYSAAAEKNIYAGEQIVGPYETYFATNHNIKFEVIVDRMGIETFVNDGELYYMNEYNSVDEDHKLEVFARGRGPTKLLIKNFEVYELNSIWHNSSITNED